MTDPVLRSQPEATALRQAYRPSNGTEGDVFYDQWCSRCARDAAYRDNPDSGDGCPIVASTFVFEIDHPEYPSEWIEDEKGPRCTAFTTDPTMPTRCDKTPDMFGGASPVSSTVRRTEAD